MLPSRSSLWTNLAASGFDAFLDKTDIAPGEPWRERLAGLIAAADTVVFVVSPDAVASEVCAWELEESARRGKRVMPIVTRRIADEEAPQALGRLNFIFCTKSDEREAAFSALDMALRTDLPWVREHTRLGELAQRWQDRGRAKSATLRGADLDAAERWLDRRPADANAPTELHQDFIRASRHATMSRQRGMVGGAAIVALVALALAGWAEIKLAGLDEDGNGRATRRRRQEFPHRLKSSKLAPPKLGLDSSLAVNEALAHGNRSRSPLRPSIVPSTKRRFRDLDRAQ
jgi:hypothetical protein